MVTDNKYILICSVAIQFLLIWLKIKIIEELFLIVHEMPQTGISCSLIQSTTPHLGGHFPPAMWEGGGCCINSDPSNCTRFLALLGSQISTKPLKGDYSSVFRFYRERETDGTESK